MKGNGITISASANATISEDKKGNTKFKTEGSAAIKIGPIEGSVKLDNKGISGGITFSTGGAKGGNNSGGGSKANGGKDANDPGFFKDPTEQ